MLRGLHKASSTRPRKAGMAARLGGRLLRGLAKASATGLGKAVVGSVMGVFAIGFAIWGIGDIFRGFGRNAVATIGGTEISIEQFRQFYNDRLEQTGRHAR